MKYENDPRFSGYLFEGSFVLGIAVKPQTVVFRCDFALAGSHPLYVQPVATPYCFRTGELIFEGATDIAYTPSGRPPTPDAAGEPDIGEIDSFLIEAGNLYRLEGSWGELSLRAEKVGVRLD